MSQLVVEIPKKMQSPAPARKGILQRSAIQDGPESMPPIVYEVLRSPGHPLNAETRAFMEPRFGQDFSKVRVHTDAKAAESAKVVNALAYTEGRDIVFSAGLYAPESGEGKQLLAHELAHVVQQSANTSMHISPAHPVLLTQPSDVFEVEANRIEKEILHESRFFPIGFFSKAESMLARQGKQEGKETKKSVEPLTYDEVKTYVVSNNKSTKVTDDLVICLIWKESGFNPTVKNSSSTATGFMQVTKASVTDVNKNFNTDFKHSEMTDPAKNIQCGTYYIDLRIKWAKGSITSGLNGFGTGAGYADTILECEKCLKGKPGDPVSCLYKIHK